MNYQLALLGLGIFALAAAIGLGALYVKRNRCCKSKTN